MIQDIYPHKMNNQYMTDANPAAADVVLNIFDGKLLLDEKALEEDVVTFPLVSQFEAFTDSLTYLFKIDEKQYFLLGQKLDEADIPSGFIYVEERGLRKPELGPADEIFAATTGKHLADWYRDTCFCGRCGGKMKHSTKERAMTCESCGYTAYPRIMPAVIVGVRKEDQLLITRYRTGFAHNALIAGFTEIGETVEETVKREVMEEAGISVKNIRYYKSQPWGTANDILLGFYCDVDGDTDITMDSEELKYAQWVNREEIVLQPGSFSLTNEMMKLFKEGKA